MSVYSQNLKIWLENNTSHKNYQRIEKLSNSLFGVVEKNKNIIKSYQEEIKLFALLCNSPSCSCVICRNLSKENRIAKATQWREFNEARNKNIEALKPLRERLLSLSEQINVLKEAHANA